jgi:hypothetical protein
MEILAIGCAVHKTIRPNQLICELLNNFLYYDTFNKLWTDFIEFINKISFQYKKINSNIVRLKLQLCNEPKHIILSADNITIDILKSIRLDTYIICITVIINNIGKNTCFSCDYGPFISNVHNELLKMQTQLRQVY